MILASKSPRRKEILENFGFSLEIIAPDIEEISDKLGVIEQIMDIARKKANYIGEKNNSEFIIAADTVVVHKGKILGKPKDENEAKEMLETLAGDVHEVITAYSIVNVNKKIEIVSYDITEVKFKEIDKKIIEWYISTKEPMDKAGAYGIQGKGNILVQWIKGDFFTVMGLPLGKIVEDFLKIGVTIENISKI